MDNVSIDETNYKKAYFDLKKQIMNDKFNSNQVKNKIDMNSLLKQELINLIFVINDHVLGNDFRSIIFSLIEEFNYLTDVEIKHNIELSQFYVVNKEILRSNLFDNEKSNLFDNCEIVLKYIDSTVYVTDAKIRHSINWKGNQSTNSQIDCHVGRGLIKFYIKQKQNDLYKYSQIKLIRLQKTNSILPYMHCLFYNQNEIDRLELISMIGINKAQSDAILALAMNDGLKNKNDSTILNSIKTINDLIEGTKEASIKAQLHNIKTKTFFSTVPNKESIDTALSIAKNISYKSDFTLVMVPGNEPLFLQSNIDTKMVRGICNENSTKVENNDFALIDQIKKNTLNSDHTNSRVALAIDSNLIVIQIAKIKSIQSIQPVSTKLSIMTNDSTKLNQLIKPMNGGNKKTNSVINQLGIINLINQLNDNLSQSSDYTNPNNLLNRLELQDFLLDDNSNEIKGGVDYWFGENIDEVHSSRHTYSTDTMKRDENNNPIIDSVNQVQKRNLFKSFH